MKKTIAEVLLLLLLLPLFSVSALANDAPPPAASPKGQNVIIDNRAIGTESPASMESPGAAGAEAPQTNPASTGGSSADVHSQTPETNGEASGSTSPQTPAASSSQEGMISYASKEDPKPTARENAAPSDSTSTDAAQTAEKDSAESELAATEPAPAARQLVLWALLAFLLLMAAGGIVRKRKK